MQGKVLLPLDSSECSLKAFIPAKSIAEMLDMHLYIVQIGAEIRVDTNELECFMVSRRSGVAEDIIIEESNNCDYVVMGTDIASKTGYIVENIHKPILLIKPDACLNIKDNKWIPHKALIPLNGAPGSAQAYTPAMRILAKTCAEIELLHVFHEKTEPIKEIGGFSAPYYVDFPQHEWPSWSKEFLRRFCPVLENHNYIKLGVTAAKGDPADEILAFAEKNANDFIAIAWHGTMSEFRALTLKRILAKTKCPIMLIKIKD